MTTKNHINDWCDCNKCGIASPHKVFFRGSRNPRILFVGEAPTRSDTVTKMTYSGSSGKVFDQLMRDVGLKKKDWCVTTSVICLPLTEDFKFRPPSKEEAENCTERLDELIEYLSPQRYVSLGKFPKKYFPKGLTFHFEIDSPINLMLKGGVESNEYKRTKFYLRRFLEEINYYGGEKENEKESN